MTLKKAISLTRTIRGFIALFLAIALILIASKTAFAQVDGLTLRTPPMTHAFIDETDILLGAAYSYSNVDYPGYQIANINLESITTTEQTIFLAYGFYDTLAIGYSNNPTEIRLKGRDAESGDRVDTKMVTTRSYLYLIPTLKKWEKSRIALIWGKGQAVVQENKTVGTDEEIWTIGTTGLVGEFFLGDSFSIVPWLSWPYLLFDIYPLTINEVQTPDWGIDGIIYIGDAKISLTFINQAIDTYYSANDDDEERTESDSDQSSSQQSYAFSFSLRF